MRVPVAIVLGCCLARLAPAQQPACHPAETAQIRGRDLAAALPSLQGLPPDIVVGAMPLPGSRATLRSGQLLSLAGRYGIPLAAAPDVCFEWPMAPLQRDDVLGAMREALGVPGTRIEIIETSLNPVPKGRLEFSREQLGTPAFPDARDAAVLWRGDVVYPGGRYRIWARVRIAVPCERLTVNVPLPAGEPIALRELRESPGECFPGRGATGLSAASAVGLVPLRPIAAGAEIRAAMVTEPNDVNRGDWVQVEVISGAARLELTAKAESGGRTGALVSVRNPGSNRLFQARVTGKQKVQVMAGVMRSN